MYGSRSLCKLMWESARCCCAQHLGVDWKTNAMPILQSGWRRLTSVVGARKIKKKKNRSKGFYASNRREWHWWRHWWTQWSKTPSSNTQNDTSTVHTLWVLLVDRAHVLVQMRRLLETFWTIVTRIQPLVSVYMVDVSHKAVTETEALATPRLGAHLCLLLEVNRANVFVQVACNKWHNTWREQKSELVPGT